MTDYSIYDIRNINESYIKVIEATSRSTQYKNLTPEQAEELAKLSPSYKSNQIWGDSSNWICSTVNRIMKFQHKSFDDCFEIAKQNKPYIDDFEKFHKAIGKDISVIKSFDELKEIVNGAKQSGKLINGLTATAKTDGRARQCYSLMKNGKETNQFRITYEDDKWIIGYPMSLDYNRKFSAIGKWCHTGSFGDAEKYWNQYANTPIYYALNKIDGRVFCASFNNREIRDQKDEYANYNGWNQFWEDCGLKTPMVDDICDTETEYTVPDDVGEYEKTEDEMLEELWERMDIQLIADQLFNGMEANIEVISDRLPAADIKFTTGDDFFAINPYVDTGFLTRYAADDEIDTDLYLTFDEFVSFYTKQYPCLDSIIERDLFQSLWCDADAIDVTNIYDINDKITIHDTVTMEDRIPCNMIKNFLKGTYKPNSIDKSKYEDIRDCFRDIERKYARFITDSMNSIFKRNEFSILFDEYGMTITIDADEAMHLASLARDDGEPTDILRIAMKNPKDSFAILRPHLYDTEREITALIAKIKGICISQKDLPFQTNWDYEFKSYSSLGSGYH